MQFPQIPRNPYLHPQPTDDGFQIPNWNCFCCQDTGIVRAPIIRRHIDRTYDPNPGKDDPLIECACGQPPALARTYIKSIFSREHCRELDRLTRQDWVETGRNYAQQQERLAALKTQINQFVHGSNKPFTEF